MRYETAEYKAYNRKREERDRIITENRRRRMKGEPALQVPEKPAPPLALIAYSKSGEWLGRIASEDEAPEGSIVKREPAKY